MIKSNMIYDIRTSQYAQETLTNLTGVPMSVWQQYLGREHEYKYTDYLVEEVIKSYGYFLPKKTRGQVHWLTLSTSNIISKAFYRRNHIEFNKIYCKLLTSGINYVRNGLMESFLIQRN